MSNKSPHAIVKKCLESAKIHAWDCLLAGKSAQDISWCNCWIRDAREFLGLPVTPLVPKSNNGPDLDAICKGCKHKAKDHAQNVNLCTQNSCECFKFEK